MSPDRPVQPIEERDQDLLTRAEASDYLLRFGVRLRASTLARLWSVGGDGPPCLHIRSKPWYPRAELRAWALSQSTGLRRFAGDRAEPPEPPE